MQTTREKKRLQKNFWDAIMIKLGCRRADPRFRLYLRSLGQVMVITFKNGSWSEHQPPNTGKEVNLIPASVGASEGFSTFIFLPQIGLQNWLLPRHMHCGIQ